MPILLSFDKTEQPRKGVQDMVLDPSAYGLGPHNFQTTRWSLVLRAGNQDSAGSDIALAELCRQYWYPLYAYTRRRGFNSEDARDLTQSFFAMLLEKGSVGLADSKRGRFRTFLLTSMQNFLAGQWRKEQTLKRGGGLEILSLDYEEAEDQYTREPTTDMDPETIYQRKWALRVIERAAENLEEKYNDSGKGDLFRVLKDTLGGGELPRPYGEMAKELGMQEGALRTAISRLRLRWSNQIRVLVAETVEDESELKDELNTLISALGNSL